MARLARDAFTAVALTNPGNTPYGVELIEQDSFSLNLSHLINYHFIVKGTKEWHFWLSRHLHNTIDMTTKDAFYLYNLYPEQIVFQRVDDNKDVTELCRENSAPVVSPVFRPHNVHLGQ